MIFYSFLIKYHSQSKWKSVEIKEVPIPSRTSSKFIIKIFFHSFLFHIYVILLYLLFSFVFQQLNI